MTHPLDPPPPPSEPGGRGWRSPALLWPAVLLLVALVLFVLFLVLADDEPEVQPVSELSLGPQR